MLAVWEERWRRASQALIKTVLVTTVSCLPAPPFDIEVEFHKYSAFNFIITVDQKFSAI